MQRRTLLKSLAASGLAGASIGTVSSRSRPAGEIDDLDAIHVVRDGETVETVENPTDRDFLRLEASLGSDEGLVTPDGTCSTYCKEDCATVCEHGDCECDGEDDCNYTHTCADTKYCCGVDEN